MYATTGRRISIIGHSQGGMLPRWALRFWPDTRAMVDDDIGFAPSNHGTTGARTVCSFPCPAADWQQRDDSQFIAALNSYQETFPGISYTEVYSHFDEIVTPNSDDTGSSSVHGGGGAITNVAIQDVCPADPSEHLAIGTQDYVAYDLAIDALEHPGPADPARAPANDPSSAPHQDDARDRPDAYPANLAASSADLAANTASAPPGARRAAAPLLRDGQLRPPAAVVAKAKCKEKKKRKKHKHHAASAKKHKQCKKHKKHKKPAGPALSTLAATI